MIITKKAIPRRTFLRGAGAMLALPLLDAMVPAFATAKETAAQPAVRLTFFYVPNGVIMENWTPAVEGADFQFTPILEPLAPFRDRLLVLSGLTNAQARALPGEQGAGHARASAAFLTGAHPKQTEGADIRAGASVDQIAASELGKSTQLASLELTMESPESPGGSDSGYNDAYTNTISWSTPTSPVPMDSDPRVVFERLFGDSDSTDPAKRLARIRTNRSILDSMGQEVTHLLTKLGPTDRVKLTQYLETIRAVEQRVQIAEAQGVRDLPRLERPVGVPETYDEHAELMLDLLGLAYQGDMTRVCTFLLGREFTNRSYREIGIAEPYHALSHHQNDPQKLAKVTQINTFHVKMLAYFLEKLRSAPDGDGNLLDHSMIVYGGGLGDGNLHLPDNVPVLLAGGGAGKVKGGRHLRYPKETPLANLYLSMLDMIGIPAESLGDSTGKLELVSL